MIILAKVTLMSHLAEHEVFERVGEAGFERICAAFYSQVPADDVLGPMYPAEDLPGAEQRLRDFLIYRFGGPATYIQQRGHPRLRARHMPFRIDALARDRWMKMMRKALEDAEIDAAAQLTLLSFFEHMSDFLKNADE